MPVVTKCTLFYKTKIQYGHQISRLPRIKKNGVIIFLKKESLVAGIVIDEVVLEIAVEVLTVLVAIAVETVWAEEVVEVVVRGEEWIFIIFRSMFTQKFRGIQLLNCL